MIKEINMKNICVITGASSGIGKEFFMSLSKDSDFNFDEIWAIARSEERLAALGALCDIPVKAIPLDLSREESYTAYEKLLSDEEVNVSLLVNCSGFGKFESTEKVGYDTSLNMIELGTYLSEICLTDEHIALLTALAKSIHRVMLDKEHPAGHIGRNLGINRTCLCGKHTIEQRTLFFPTFAIRHTAQIYVLNLLHILAHKPRQAAKEQTSLCLDRLMLNTFKCGISQI